MVLDTKRIAENIARSFTAARIFSGYYESRGTGKVTIWVKAHSSGALLSLKDAGALIAVANNHLMKIMNSFDMRRGHMEIVEYIGAENNRICGLAMRRFAMLEDTEAICKGIGLNGGKP